ncbi:hypothetical protein C825_001973 [Parabacteroides sp. ASF519]|nr:hypothetical protein C825_001973 [Parabacteroides sp. ASF519]
MKKCILLFIAIIGLSTQFSCTDYLDKARSLVCQKKMCLLNM